MQAILNCLRIAVGNINDFNKEKKNIEITTPDVVNTIYRLIYLSKVSIAFQALSLLLQLVLVQDENHDRYYNALYRKMLDSEILSASNKITSLYFHIIHRSIQRDPNTSRCKAFLKRLLQMTLSFSPAKACGSLIVINKILKVRPELACLSFKNVKTPTKQSHNDTGLSKFEDDSDSDEVYNDIKLGEDGQETKVDIVASEATSSSWVHVENTKSQKLSADPVKQQTEYDPFKRSAAFSGAEFTLFYELSLMSRHFHPTVVVFVENILKNQKINYFGDPLKDFSLSQFLERFSFKNPKKADPNEKKSAFHNSYHPKGSRGQSVYLLTAQNCTEDEKFIFDFIQRKREIREKKTKFKDEEDDDLESVDDDEFDAYLDSLGAAKGIDKNDRDFDYLSEVTDSKKVAKNGKKKSESGSEEDEDDLEQDFDQDSEDSDVDNNESELDSDDESDTNRSIENEDESMNSESENEEFQTKPKNAKKKIKKSKGDNELFVAVDDFSEVIEKNSSSAHGTLGEIFNKDKSSQKQMDWELKRHNSGFKRKKNFSKKSFGQKAKRFKK